MTTLSCFDVAKYFLGQTSEDDENYISHLKLQKLLYYAQGFHLAIHDEPLFSETIEAWTHGPVVPALYNQYKHHDSNPIPCPADIDYSVYDERTKELLDDVYNVYGQYSGWKLRNMTHEEPPWRDIPIKNHGYEITHKALKSYFKTQLIDNDEETKTCAAQ